MEPVDRRLRPEGQAGAAYGLSFVFVKPAGGSYVPLFGAGAAALAFALALDLAAVANGKEDRINPRDRP